MRGEDMGERGVKLKVRVIQLSISVQVDGSETALVLKKICWMLIMPFVLECVL